MLSALLCFFFQAEDGIRDKLVTGVQTCALPISFQYLTELSDDIGSRVTGSPAERKAEQWGVAKMKALGLENVHTEKYQLWRGWTRGMAQGELLEPIRRPLHVDAMGWTGSTPAGGAEGQV